MDDPQCGVGECCQSAAWHRITDIDELALQYLCGRHWAELFIDNPMEASCYTPVTKDLFPLAGYMKIRKKGTGKA